MKNFVFVLSTALMSAAAPVHATQPPKADVTESVTLASASYAEDLGTVERIISGEHLRTYTQEVAAAACFLYNGIAPDLSSQLLNEARNGFDVHLDALMNGNEAIGIIGGEERRKTIAKLEAIRDDWASIATAVDTLLDDPNNSDAVGVIKSENLTLFAKTDILVSELEGQYSNPAELLQVDVLIIEIVGRQSMMTQKIASTACKIYSGKDTAEVKEALTQSIGIYEASLNALLNGMPELGIKPAPTEEIAAGLKIVLADWQDTRPHFDSLLAGETIEREVFADLFEHMVDEMKKLEEISHAYVEFSKHEY